MLIDLFQNFAASSTLCKPSSFFGIPAWYEYLYKAGKVIYNVGTNTCEMPNFVFPNDLGLVGLGILDILLHVVGLIAVGFVMYGGIRYIASQGEPDKTKQAQGTIVDALVGTLLAIIAVAVVSFIGARIGGGHAPTHRGIDLSPLPNTAANATALKTILSTVFGVIGAIALLVITIQGLRFELARGNPQVAAQARNAIIYAAVGLLISINAIAIINFVLGRV